MNIKHFCFACGLTILGAILLVVREQLIAISGWLFGLLILVVLACVSYGLYWLYDKFHRLYYGVQLRQLEIEERQTTMYLARSRVQVGESLYLLHPTALPSQQDILYLPARQQVVNALPQQAESRQGEPEQAFSAIPVAIRYEDVRAQIPRGHSLLGISEHGLETCDFKDLMTMLICGGSSTGKSNTVAIKLHEAISIGKNTRMVVIDPHKNKRDSLYNKIRQYESRFLMPVASKDDEIMQALTWFRREFQRRMELSTQDLAELDDILLVCDEVYSLVYHREDDKIAKMIKVVSGIAGYESRGYGMFAWFLTQKVTGLKWLRDAVMTTICHKMQTMSERVLAANDDRAIAREMDNWTMPGRIVVFGLNLPVTVTQMPLMEPTTNYADLDPLPPLEDLPKIFQSEQSSQFGRSSEDNAEAHGRNKETDPELQEFVLRKFLADARKMRDGGASIDAILKHFGLPAGGYKNQIVKALLDEPVNGN